MAIGSVSETVSMALDGLVLRQQVIAQNIANLNTPGYTPQRVDFESALQNPAGGGPRILPDTLAGVASGPGGSAAALSHQVSELADTALRYQTLIKGINKQLAIMQLVVSDGKR
ncbi:flagellar basal body rod protein FlgB [Chromobacterium alticapitis]|uniref:Flagellar basal body rod protein FlgB n=1 Tax=Chromobacterium alticapitis TaxID=2073169 RepID=A0A2S5DL23_9NEIS|nr:flagellar basal body protein [Chromobacterium alticapitis]POZ63763.1 hypothetical protein C2I19_01540 [Chromobacterium alticapitis]